MVIHLLSPGVVRDVLSNPDCVLWAAPCHRSYPPDDVSSVLEGVGGCQLSFPCLIRRERISLAGAKSSSRRGFGGFGAESQTPPPPATASSPPLQQSRAVARPYDAEVPYRRYRRAHGRARQHLIPGVVVEVHPRERHGQEQEGVEEGVSVVFPPAPPPERRSTRRGVIDGSVAVSPRCPSVVVVVVEDSNGKGIRGGGARAAGIGGGGGAIGIIIVASPPSSRRRPGGVPPVAPLEGVGRRPSSRPPLTRDTA